MIERKLCRLIMIIMANIIENTIIKRKSKQRGDKQNGHREENIHNVKR